MRQTNNDNSASREAKTSSRRWPILRFTRIMNGPSARPPVCRFHCGRSNPGNLPHHGKRHENPVLRNDGGKSRSCAACLRLQQQLSETAQNEPQTLTCELGLSDTAVPIRFGERLVGFLQTGQVFRKKPTETQFNRTAVQVAQWGLEIENDQLKQAYFSTKVLSSKQHDGVVKLLAIFGQHISMVSNQILVQRASAEPPSITRAKQFIQENQAEDLSLGPWWPRPST